VVYGAGGHAHVVIDVLRDQGFTVEQMFNDHPENQHPDSWNVQPGIRRVGVERFPHLADPVVLCVGNNAERAELAHLLRVEYATACHSTAIIAPTVRIGEGTVVLHGAILQNNAVIGRHALINTAASIDHDNIIGDFVHVSPHATLCGHVEVGEGTHIGAGATVIPKVKIGRWCTVGAGAVVLHDLADHVTAVGNPARVLADRSGQRRPEFESPPSTPAGGRLP
jgi:acetyltransferase EpsM